MDKVEIQSKRLIFNDFFKIQEAILRYLRFDGKMSEPVRRLVFERGDAVAAIIFNRDTQKVLLINQFRYPTYEKGPGWMQEAVAGILEPNETPEDALRRELIEEIGYRVGDLTHISTFYVSPGGSSERITLYYAEVGETDRIAAGGGLASEGENIQFTEVALPELWSALDAGEIMDAKTIIGAMWLRRKQEEISMARDATNMPFERPTSYQNNDSTEQATGSEKNFDPSLKMENMLLEEFNYASVTAYQAMEDRARISNFYYILLGVLVSALVAIIQFSGGTRYISLPLVAILLFIGALISISFFVTLIRLRQAYKDSLLTMNVIKEFYIEQFKQQMPAIEPAFHWRLATMPKGERIGSVTFVIAALNAFIGSLCLGGAVFFITEQPLSVTWASVLAGAVFILAMVAHISYYRKELSKERETKAISKQEKELETSLNESTE